MKVDTFFLVNLRNITESQGSSSCENYFECEWSSKMVEKLAAINTANAVNRYTPIFLVGQQFFGERVCDSKARKVYCNNGNPPKIPSNTPTTTPPPTSCMEPIVSKFPKQL